MFGIGEQRRDDSTIESTTKLKPSLEVDQINGFVKQEPNATYFFTGQARQTKLCRRIKNNQKCLDLTIPTAKILEQMQKMDFFCALSQDVENQQIECQRII
ncbi:hypothetical protein V1514DRAFT_326947 [Lipomyces japonicus]|uniref:uncharacterized protein n=1 Tax=Lipomyces japonicus TaxID=56871 RepID=UPI0034CE97A1